MAVVELGTHRLWWEESGQGPALILVSGVGYGLWCWRWMRPLLARSFRVICFDNRGVGLSTAPSPPWTTRELAGDVVALMDGLGLARVHVLGHSLGGLVAQELALGWPERVEKLVLASTHHGGPEVVPIPPDALALLLDRSGDLEELLQRGLAVGCAPGFAQRSPEVVEALLAYRRSGPVPPAVYQAQVEAGARHDARARLSALSHPTLLLSGAEDRVVPPENNALILALLPRARMTTLPGAGHLFPVEVPAAAAAVVADFLAE